MNFLVKDIIIDKKIVAKVFRYKNKKFKGIKFYTASNLNMQVGSMCHVKNHLIKPHFHINRKKIIKQMSELLIIFSGQLKVDFYNKNKLKAKSIIINKKDMILLISGGHGFKVLKKLEMLEIKQGPFTGEKDKIRLEKF
jgi:mannose-6-phosphate isomerase-like protein (cupin superfamily)